MRKWANIEELANLILERSRAQKTVTLSADTAMFVGLKLQKVDAKPSRDDVARILCNGGCEALCYMCRGKANEICAAYGSSMD